MKGHFFHKEIGVNTYQISCTEWELRGGAVINIYLIIGTEKAVLLDLGLSLEGLHDYLKTITRLPIMPILTHAHPDHYGCAGDFKDLWMHPEERATFEKQETFLEFSLPTGQDCTIHEVREGEEVQLGERVLHIYGVQGHTSGSLLFLDTQEKILFSGDTIGTHCLYGSSQWIPLGRYFEGLSFIETLDFTEIWTSHDSIPMPKTIIRENINKIRENLPKATHVWKMDAQEFINFIVGNPDDGIHFFDFSMPKARLKEVMVELGGLHESRNNSII